MEKMNLTTILQYRPIYEITDAEVGPAPGLSISTGFDI